MHGAQLLMEGNAVGWLMVIGILGGLVVAVIWLGVVSVRAWQEHRAVR